jgi:hypothetical protein
MDSPFECHLIISNLSQALIITKDMAKTYRQSASAASATPTANVPPDARPIAMGVPKPRVPPVTMAAPSHKPNDTRPGSIACLLDMFVISDVVVA